MKTSVKNKIIKIIKDNYRTDTDFIIDVIAPEIEEEDFEVDEVCKIYEDETIKIRLSEIIKNYNETNKRKT